MTAIPDRLAAALADRYTLERELGAGGMATVYLAHDLKHDRKVAIKVLRSELAAVLGAERFLHEIQITAKLHHPHILPLYDSGESQGFLYYAMPYVAGETLRERLNGPHRFSLVEALRLTREAAEALDYAHRQGVVHRDIKPENILIDEGHAVVADFGIARAVTSAGAEHLTQTGLAVGTPAYMSPEQSTGSEVDGRSDLFSLACVMYEMITARTPFGGSTPQEAIARRLTEAVEPASRHRADTPHDLDTLLIRALATHANDRFETAGEFAAAIDRLLSAGTQGLEVTRRARRWPLVVILIVVTAASALAVQRQVAARRFETRTLDSLGGLLAARDLDGVAAYVDRHDVHLEARFLDGLRESMAGRVRFQLAAGSPVVRIDRVTREGALVPGIERSAPFDDWLVAGEWVVRVGSAEPPTLTLPLTVRAGALADLAPVLPPEDAPDMVVVPAGPDPRTGTAIGAFLIDRYEVTNEAYFAFVSAGGYAQGDLWPATMVVDERSLARADALRLLVDRSGLPGPREWSAGRYREGEARHPVRGVSWYEAAAFAAWAGKALPTAAEWFRAAMGDQTRAYPWGDDVMSVDQRANFGADGGVQAVGSRPAGVSPFGVFDMAGNVREWTVDQQDGRHIALGAAWLEPNYAFTMPEAHPDGTRRPQIGFRLVRRLHEGANP